MIDVLRDIPVSWECPECGAPPYRGNWWTREKALCTPDCPTREDEW